MKDCLPTEQVSHLVQHIKHLCNSLSVCLFRTWSRCKVCGLAPNKESSSVWQQRQSAANQAVGPPHGICTDNSVSLHVQLLPNLWLHTALVAIFPRKNTLDV